MASPRPSPPYQSGRRVVGLAKSLEHVRQEFFGDAAARIGDANFRRVVGGGDGDLDPSAFLIESHSVGQEISNHLLEPASVAGDHRRPLREARHNLDTLGVG